MKKTMNLILSVLISISFSLNLSSQSDQKNLDQVELVKQFIGNWVSEIGKDSTILVEVIPSGEGLYFQAEWKSNGKTYATARSIIGFNNTKELLALSSVWQNGTTTMDIGKFVTENKLVTERFFPDKPNHAVALSEIDFPSPETYIWSMKARGQNITWEPLWLNEWTFTKINE